MCQAVRACRCEGGDALGVGGIQARGQNRPEKENEFKPDPRSSHYSTGLAAPAEAPLISLDVEQQPCTLPHPSHSPPKKDTPYSACDTAARPLDLPLLLC